MSTRPISIPVAPTVTVASASIAIPSTSITVAISATSITVSVTTSALARFKTSTL